MLGVVVVAAAVAVVVVDVDGARRIDVNVSVDVSVDAARGDVTDGDVAASAATTGEHHSQAQSGHRP